MQGIDVYKVLKNKSINNLYHANTVTTSCSFLKLGGLASRGYVTDHGLPQTSQYTDNIDKKYEIWYDIFVDTVDIHDRTRSINWYGPALFVLEATILIDLPEKSEVLVTKGNPTKWTNGGTIRDRFFTTPEELDIYLEKGTFDQMIVIRTPEGILQFPRDTVSIVLDDPQLELPDVSSVFLHAKHTLESVDTRMDLSITKRLCWPECACIEQYKTKCDIKKYFL